MLHGIWPRALVLFACVSSPQRYCSSPRAWLTTSSWQLLASHSNQVQLHFFWSLPLFTCPFPRGMPVRVCREAYTHKLWKDISWFSSLLDSLILHGRYLCTSTSNQSSDATSSEAGGPTIYSQGEFNNAFFETFQSPKSDQWPNHYFPNMECWFNYSAPIDHKVYVEFPLFFIEGRSTFCDWDKDLVSIGTVLGDRLVCGFPSDYGATITGRSNVSVHFKTNNVIEQVGFTGYFWSYEAPSALCK